MFFAQMRYTTTFVPFFRRPVALMLKFREQLAMRSLIVYVLLKILPERLTATASAFILDRGGMSASAASQDLASEKKTPIYATPGTTTSAAF